MLASAAQRLIRLYAVKPCNRCVILTGNADGYAAALELHEVGTQVAGIADPRAMGEPGELGRRVAAAGIQVYPGHAIYEALPGCGKARVRGALLCPLGPDGQPLAESTISLDCDGIIVSVGWAPNA